MKGRGCARVYVCACEWNTFQSRTVCCRGSDKERESKNHCACKVETHCMHVQFDIMCVCVCVEVSEWSNLRERGNEGWERKTEIEREKKTEEADQLSGQRVAQKPNFTLH